MFMVKSVTSTVDSLAYILPDDIVSLVDCFLSGRPAHHFYHRCRNMCAHCGLCARPSCDASHIVHRFVQTRFTSLVAHIVDVCTTRRDLQHWGVFRDLLRTIHSQFTTFYIAYVERMNISWMLTHNLISGHLSVICSAACLRFSGIIIEVLRQKTPLQWEPFVFDLRTISQYHHPQRQRRQQIINAENRCRRRIMLRHPNRMSEIICKELWQCPIIQQCRQLRYTIQARNKLATQLSTLHKNLCTDNSVKQRTLEGMFDVQSTQTVDVDQKFWQS